MRSALVGIQQGIFTKNLPSNVTLQTSSYNAGPAEVTALLAGSLDAGYMGPNSAITAYSQGHGAIRIISGATSAGRGAGGLLLDHLAVPAEGQDSRHPTAGQHPRRRAADLAEEAGPDLPGTERRER